MPKKPDGKMVRAGSRTYFFDLKRTKAGKKYLVITESRYRSEDEERERQRITVFPEDSRAFFKAVTEMVGKL
jgi:hypothetical protein